jgi:hypothetical protein
MSKPTNGDKLLKPNEYQVGGAHYKTAYEHWDLCLNTKMGYLEGNATRYIVRWRKKGGVEDLRKALHYVNKLIEWASKGNDRTLAPMWVADITVEVMKFAKINDLRFLEVQACQHIAGWTKLDDLCLAQEEVLKMIDIEENREPRLDLTDPDPVPLTEENHYSPRVNRMADMQEDED